MRIIASNVTICYKSNTTGVTCGAGTAYPSEATEFTTGL